ncbi:YncE family protein [Roseovarius autotrophicus]|uniref:YncE family protein n=1 Tax=Roseovarius autotrophicus TaxID=2824121 RepID=UPI00300D8B87
MRRGSEALALALLAAPAVADLAYVTCQSGEEVSVIDLATLSEVARWPLPGKPAGVAVVAGAVYTVAAETKTVRRHAPSGALMAEAVLDGGPIGIAVDAVRGRVFVSDWYEARVRVLDAATLMPLADLATAAAPAGLDLSPDGRFLAAAERDADRVSVFDAATLAPLWQAPVGIRPFGLRFAPDGRLFVANVGSDDVTVLDTGTGAALATIKVGARPYGVGFAGGRAFVTNQYAETISVIALNTLAVVATLDVGEYPEGVDSTRDGLIAVANWFSNTLSVIDAETLETIAEIETCDGPRAFGAFVAPAQ